ncbi:HAD hydrolase-like protein [Lentisphaera profundi]|uniref:phosphoglycolate phosphatase n=1 Tax=Lentisphaera profundi TaxID=1658616 RepID=A0ABY7VY75_9BACT|nr:HAD family hydrolase [Lentisphaera profundi]WDE98228.1 HAD hydrolase-like protein [Lentisphaera profundi]
MNKPAAIIDFDGTLTRVRCGWEDKMKEFFLSKIFTDKTTLSPELSQEARSMCDEWIAQAPGTTIVQQISALANILDFCKITYDFDRLIDEFDIYSSDWEYQRVNECKESGELESLMLLGARKFLEDLQALGYELHLLSGTSHEKLIFECKTLGLSHFFKHIQGFETHLAMPYKPQSIRKTIADYKYEVKSTLIIGDGLTELNAGRELKCPCIGVAIDENDGKSCDTHKLQILKDAGFEDIISDFDNALQFIPLANPAQN